MIMRAIRLTFIVMVMAAMACSVFGGGATEEAATATPTKEATVTKASAGIQKEATPILATKVQEEATSSPEAAETPGPTTSSAFGSGIQELIFPHTYVATDDAKNTELVDFRVFRQEFWGGDLILGLIKNTGSVNLGSMGISVAGIDASGEIVTIDVGWPSISKLYAGETISFRILSRDKFPEETKEVIVAIKADELSDYYLGTHNYEIISTEIKRLSDGDLMVSVRFRNENDYDTYAVSVGIALFDDDNRIIASGMGFAQNTDTVFPAGSEGEINFVQNFVAGDFARYELIVEGEIIEE
jgi:hypothetical protein